MVVVPALSAYPRVGLSMFLSGNFDFVDMPRRVVAEIWWGQAYILLLEMKSWGGGPAGYDEGGHNLNTNLCHFILYRIKKQQTELCLTKIYFNYRHDIYNIILLQVYLFITRHTSIPLFAILSNAIQFKGIFNKYFFCYISVVMIH